MRSIVRRIVGVVAIIAFFLPWMEIPYIGFLLDDITGLTLIKLGFTEGLDYGVDELLILGIVAAVILLAAIIMLIVPNLGTSLVFAIPSAIFLILLYSEGDFSEIKGIGITVLLLATIGVVVSFFLKDEKRSGLEPADSESNDLYGTSELASAEDEVASSREKEIDDEKRFCIHCGNALRSGVKFCSACGVEVRG